MAKFQFLEWLVAWLGRQPSFEFIWDKGNTSKSKDKHSVENQEAEEAFDKLTFFPLGIQIEPEVEEPRFGLLGKTKKGRLLHIAFTIREGKIRIISARPMHKKERKEYEQNLR